MSASAPSPMPAAMPPPPTLKRPRQSAAGTSTPTGGPAGSGQATNPRVKRRKNEAADDAAGADSSDTGTGRGNAKGKGKEDGETGDSGEVQTKIDFRDLPDDTLWKYLEAHDLLPRWDVSPWSEEPCVPPNALYLAQAQAATAPAPTDEAVIAAEPAAMPQKPEDQFMTEPHVELPIPREPTAEESTAAPATLPVTDATADATPSAEQNGDAAQNGGAEDDGGEGEDAPAPPTTRSKTAPTRKRPTPEATPALGYQRPVITLSDVMAARDILAEKANAHWIKGLGGGQNKEGETIVNFLYKMKVGPGRLLRIYNPPPAPPGAL